MMSTVQFYIGIFLLFYWRNEMFPIRIENVLTYVKDENFIRKNISAFGLLLKIQHSEGSVDYYFMIKNIKHKLLKFSRKIKEKNLKISSIFRIFP